MDQRRDGPAGGQADVKTDGRTDGWIYIPSVSVLWAPILRSRIACFSDNKYATCLVDTFVGKNAHIAI